MMLSLVVFGLVQASGAGGSVTGILRGTPRDLLETVIYLAPIGERGADLGSPDSLLIDQRGLRFWPRVVMVPTGGTVLFRNSDPILHNVFSPGVGPEFDLGTYPRPDFRPHTFQTAGVHVMLCHIHPEMAAYIVVVPGGQAGAVDERGRFRFDSVPPGAYQLVAWRPRRVPIRHDLVVAIGTATSVELDLSNAQRRR